MNFLKRLFGGKTADNTLDIPNFLAQSAQVESSHVHDWKEKLLSYAPPCKDINTPTPETLHGVTTVLYECVICHLFNTVTLLGTTKPQLDDLVDKIATYGPQYFQRNGITYVLQQYQAQPAVLPLR